MSDVTRLSISHLRDLYTGDPAEIEEVLPPPHPGSVLREDFMRPLALSAGGVAKALGLPRSRIERIVREEIGISTDTALRLARYFGTTHQFWLALQTGFESAVLLAQIGPSLDRIEPLSRDAA